MLHLSRLNEVLHRTGYIFNRHLRVNAVLVEQGDTVSLKPLETSIGYLLDVLGLAVESAEALSAGREVEAELRGNHHLLAEWSVASWGASSFLHFPLLHYGLPARKV